MKTFTLQREVPVDKEYDLVVAGGGPAGAVAAIAAGRLGAKVLLVESTGCMGGMGTSGLVTAFNPMANGNEMMVGGVMREIVETLYRTGGLGPNVRPETFNKLYGKWVPFNVEAYKHLLDQMALAAGVEVRFFTRVIDADVDKRNRHVNGVIIHNVEGYRFVPAKTFIDATGDAILADLCGVECREAGRDTPHIMPATLPSLFANMDWNALGSGDEAWHKENNALKKALADGHFTQYDRQLPGMFRVTGTVGFLNGGHLFNLNALRNDSMSKGVMLGRRLAQEYLSFYRKYVPGCANMEHVVTASLIGVRESRRIVGEYELTVHDYQARRHFDDDIGIFNNFIDIHPYDCTDEAYEQFCKEKSFGQSIGPGESFGMPYGMLVPKGWSNLWVAGRCASADVQAHGVIRVQPSCALMGQAAGTAAVQASRSGEPACDLNTGRLIDTLINAGSHLPFSRGATRTTAGVSAVA